MDTQAVRYLLLGLGVPIPTYFNNDIYTEYEDSVKKASEKLGIDILPVYLISGSRLTNKRELQTKDGIYMFKFPNESRDDNQAQKIAEAIISSYTLIKGPFSFEPARTFRFQTSMLKKDRFLFKDQILDLWKKQFPYNNTGYPLYGGVLIGIERMISIWDIVPLMIKNDLSKAMKYLRTSFREFYVYPGEIPEVLGKSDESPKSSYIKAEFENALLNAFKTIEALIGEPPKNNNKFFKKLLAIGINPKYKLSYPNKKNKPIYKVIRGIHRDRDKKAAHGSTPVQRNITYFELMEYQFCAHLIVIKTIQKRLGRPICKFHKLKD